VNHRLGCSGPVISVVRGITFDLVTCRGCGAQTKRAKR
jgi:hypothetical protein